MRIPDEINAALEYLKSRGHRVGDAFVPASGKMHVWIDERACAHEHIRALTVLERMKDASNTINGRGLTDLAVLCRRIAESGEVTVETISAANVLVHEWGILVQSATPPPSSLLEMQSINEQGQALAGRMVDFLTTHLRLLSA